MQEKIIDVDIIIDKYNKKNPDKRQLDRTSLAKMLGCNKQILSDWKNGKTPKLIYRLLTLMEIGKCGIKDFVVEQKD